jgi:hypothetical protein
MRVGQLGTLEKIVKELLHDEAKGCDKNYMVLRSVLELL